MLRALRLAGRALLWAFVAFRLALLLSFIGLVATFWLAGDI